MSYAYQYTEGLKQFGMVHLILKLTDSDNILPEVIIPIILDDSENNEENLSRIVNQLINSYTTIIPEGIEDTALILEETLTNNLSTE
jgi:hypothetical protein